MIPDANPRTWCSTPREPSPSCKAKSAVAALGIAPAFAGTAFAVAEAGTGTAASGVAGKVFAGAEVRKTPSIARQREVQNVSNERNPNPNPNWICLAAREGILYGAEDRRSIGFATRKQEDWNLEGKKGPNLGHFGAALKRSTIGFAAASPRSSNWGRIGGPI